MKSSYKNFYIDLKIIDNSNILNFIYHDLQMQDFGNDDLVCMKNEDNITFIISSQENDITNAINSFYRIFSPMEKKIIRYRTELKATIAICFVLRLHQQRSTVLKIPNEVICFLHRIKCLVDIDYYYTHPQEKEEGINILEVQPSTIQLDVGFVFNDAAFQRDETFIHAIETIFSKNEVLQLYGNFIGISSGVIKNDYLDDDSCYKMLFQYLNKIDEIRSLKIRYNVECVIVLWAFLKTQNVGFDFSDNLIEFATQSGANIKIVFDYDPLT